MDEFFVGSLALALAILTTVIAIGPWTAPYQIRSVKYVQNRFGKSAARALWLAVAIITAASGVAILQGIRPGYAIPNVRTESLR
ncbi:hypothetical protein [Allorhodopirellula solitaria]|uniref:Uncharacterized protein n=1 Tax=Allorhodopirellula solitaria TaxID=2527987 RepID=A0A5C5XP92_9BACT|nr:hypothetical protein [Allorhodopirellula solitaria]TWT64724.1 hypothetical protein CA85_35090 [Allorhodopirellula solitaria]